MRFLLFLGLIYMSPQLMSQQRLKVYGDIGLNRIGVLYDLGLNYQLKSHEFRIGSRFYAPDQVFEKEIPGAQIQYRYNFLNPGKTNLFAGVNLSYFAERKGTLFFQLFDPKGEIGVSRSCTNRLIISFNLGLGATQIFTKGGIINENSHFSYLNYEAKFGVSCFFGHFDNN